MTRGIMSCTITIAFAAMLGSPLLAQMTSDRITVLTELHGYYPCMDCHGDQVSVPQPRILEEEHAEPLVYEDQDGAVQRVVFGERVPIADLLASAEPGNLRSDKLARVGSSIRIETYMEFNGLAPGDSVWVMIHGGGNIWCLNCHNDPDRNKLVKLNGETLTFNDSHLLCGECHGSILADWDLGIHGKSTGFWNIDLDEAGVSQKKLCVECHNPHAPAFPAVKALPPPVPRIQRGGGPESSHE
ncbi:MAG: hypothetical protein ABIK96_06720 [bacterium]